MAHAPIRSLFPIAFAIVLCLGRVTAQAAAYKRDLFGLCTEAMAGRGTGTAGDDQAIARVGAGMEAAGRPGGAARVLRPSDYVPELVEIDGAMQVLDLAEALVRALADAEAPMPFQSSRK